MSEAAPIILTAEMGGADQRWADAMRRTHYPPEQNRLSAHITLFHHLPPMHLPEIKARASDIAKSNPKPRAKLIEVISLGRGVAYRIESPDLMDMRDALASDFHGLLIPQDQARPRLHITVQNKVEPPVAKALLHNLAAEFTPRPLEISGLAAHYYRGGPWEDISRWAFRG